ncbi:MAG: hypothetical protein GYB36_01280 [Alphaproteobacteria bacterium]|nr:hypothetical protein [Alphaproteobacteria bacterium]
MRIPFAVWSAVLAILIFAGLTARDYLNFGTLEINFLLAGIVAAVWLVLVIVVGFLGMVRKAATPRSVDLPSDVAQEIQRHPED